MQGAGMVVICEKIHTDENFSPWSNYHEEFVALHSNSVEATFFLRKVGCANLKRFWSLTLAALCLLLMDNLRQRQVI